MSTIFETEFGGRTLTIETGKLARLAGGAVTVRYGDTLVLGTANRSDPRPGLDFFPLTVEFEERMYAAGKIPGGFIKREARASEAATLAARLTDRPIRPLFPEGYKDDIQLVITVLSTDQENEADVLGTVAASAALTISEIPFAGPVGAVRVGRIDGEFVVNPTFSQLADSELDLIVSGTRDAIMMVEAGAKLLPEDVMAEAILFGHRALQPLIDIQEKLGEAAGKPKSTPFLEPGTGSVLAFVDAATRGDELVVLDVETTGTDPKMADLVEIAAVKVKKGKIIDRWSTLVNPGRPIIGKQMHGITDAEVKKAPKPADAAKEALKFIGDAVIVGHSVGFDLAFLEAALGDGTHFEQGRYLDTLPIAREGYPDLENYKLPTLSNYFGVDLSQAHRALPDAEATANLLIWFGNDLPGRINALRDGIANAIRATRSGGDSKAIQEAARREARVSKGLFNLVHKKATRKMALDEGIRMDGRGTTELRQISVDVGLLPRAHGSGLFTRGETQVLTIATLGASSDVQRIDTISPKTEKRYIHHYNFPPYSTGENKPMRGPSRRDIGHGNLAERALIPVLPTNDEFPYVIRLVSECLSSNGSTSMASTCGSTLALMDAGVPITAPVAGAAMGLISEPDGRFVVLTDILGKEDAVGDMDFKVTGTRDGITALQMDIKVQGINEAIIRDGLKQALAARLEILDKMTEVLPEARESMSDFAPRIITIKINPEKIREIIGKGGSMIRKIQEETQTEINVEDDGTVEIAAVSGENSRKAIQWIESLTREVEVGALYLGKVTRIMGFGAFVEILPGKEGLVRIGELADYHVPSVEDVVSVGDEVMVVVVEIDRQGRVNLSRKAAMQRHLAKEPV
ncbi:MAG: polyribonucleotide nucleotidyltransferase [Chloroflexi bacterium]|nr:polyribonucleotide nucleotidyltransferase [Chloroflexota bacterium]